MHAFIILLIFQILLLFTTDIFLAFGDGFNFFNFFLVQYYTLVDKHKVLNHERNELDMELRALEEAYGAASRDEHQLQAQVDRASSEVAALEAELFEQKVKIQVTHESYINVLFM